MDHLGGNLAKKLKSEKVQLVAVADFVSAEGASNGSGHAFAELLTLSIHKHNGKIRILAHGEFDEVARNAGIPATGLTLGDLTPDLARKLPEDVLIVGTVNRSSDQYEIKASAFRVHSNEMLFSGSSTVARTELLDSFITPLPPELDPPVVRLPKAGITAPTCRHCPIPEYTDAARAEKLQATVVFYVVVSAEGRAVALRPKRLAGFGLDEEAFKTMKAWRFQPAKDASGRPVPVCVEIEVSFRMF